MVDSQENSQQPKPAQIDLPSIQTALALDRTLLAWIRTALTFIGFGFTLAKFVHDLISKGMLAGVQPWYPRQLGFALIGLGLVTLIAGGLEHYSLRKRIYKGKVWSISLSITVVLLALAVSLTWSLYGELIGSELH